MPADMVRTPMVVDKVDSNLTRLGVGVCRISEGIAWVSQADQCPLGGEAYGAGGFMGQRAWGQVMLDGSWKIR